MKSVLFSIALLIGGTLLLPSCMKEEKPHAIPEIPQKDGDFEIKSNQVHLGEDYKMYAYYSLENGPIVTGNIDKWDLAFSTDRNEMWLNGGNGNLVYATGGTNYSSVTQVPTGIKQSEWKFDYPTGLPGASALGLLSATNHIGEVLIVNVGGLINFKIQIVEANDNQYKIMAGPLEAATGTEYLLDKNQDYNNVFFSFNDGIITVEPPKKDWDILFTRYQHIYYKYNPDGSDMAYFVTGVLTNTYKTESGVDSINTYDFYSFNLDNAASYTLLPNRDIIGFDWKSVNINTSAYTVNPKKVYVIKDQKDELWKFRFVGYNDDNGKKGSPKFEYQRLK
jgi:hypothetical protein